MMVCTDSAARGLDIPDIAHVVQADFATSAVDFLHRVRCFYFELQTGIGAGSMMFAGNAYNADHPMVATFDGDTAMTLTCTPSCRRVSASPSTVNMCRCKLYCSPDLVVHVAQAGRTGRAGKAGVVTSLYTEEQAPLAEAIRSEIEAGKPIEGTFSRNRSFKAKFKKYGEYVPRGQVQKAHI